MLAGTHQRQFDLVLNVFNVDGATRGHAAAEDRGDLLAQLGDCLMHTGRGGGGATFDGQVRLGDRDNDLGLVVPHDSAIALDDADLTRGGGGRGRRFLLRAGLRRGGSTGLTVNVGLHEVLHDVFMAFRFGVPMVKRIPESEPGPEINL